MKYALTSDVWKIREPFGVLVFKDGSSVGPDDWTDGSPSVLILLSMPMWPSALLIDVTKLLSEILLS